MICSANGNVNTQDMWFVKLLIPVPTFWLGSALYTLIAVSTKAGAINNKTPILPPPKVKPLCTICINLDINLPVAVAPFCGSRLRNLL